MMDSSLQEQLELYPSHDERFLNTYLGKQILNNPVIAVIELISNSWDAGATEVNILWPDNDGRSTFRIEDNGNGLTHQQFTYIWNKLSYNRRKEIGLDVLFPDDVPNPPSRTAYGANGKGRFSAFAFGESYQVDSYCQQTQNSFLIKRTYDKYPFIIKSLATDKTIQPNKHGLTITVKDCQNIRVNEEVARQEIGMRFISDPSFKVKLNGKVIKFEDIPTDNIFPIEKEIIGLGQYKITIIDLQKSDKTTQKTGVAWHVNGRLIGECDWQIIRLDGRTHDAKRFVIIVQADFLKDSIEPDWTAFKNTPEFLNTVNTITQDLQEFFIDQRRAKAKETTEDIRQRSSNLLNRLNIKERNMWQQFIYKIQVECPTINQDELLKVADILAKLELAHSRYALVEQLNQLEVGEIDDLNRLLEEWTIKMAKKVLDDIKERMLLLDRLEKTLNSDKADEVKDLQPLFHQGLWIFGPEYESIEFTSNRGMTQVAQKLFNQTIPMSKNRPDFAISVDSTVGFYSCSSYDDESAEIGISKLVILELKEPSVKIGDDTKEQCRKYYRELQEKGLVQEGTRVQCYALGKYIKNFQGTELVDGNLKVTPLLFDTVIRRAKSRLFGLRNKIEAAPFLNEQQKEDLNDFLINGKNSLEQASLHLV